MSALLVMCLIAFGASILFASVVSGWRQRFTDAALALVDLPAAVMEEPMVTLIVPARNAADTLVPLLQDLHAQDYPKEKLEVLVIDDASEDGTAGIARGMMRTWPQLRVLANDGIGKKAAITRGVREASGPLIILTDADARCGPERVRHITSHWSTTNVDMILLPVRTISEGDFLGRLQEDEQAALIGVAAATSLGGSPMLANGANIAFTKQAFLEVDGFNGDRYASGDDIFLLDRMKRAGKRVTYLLDHEALVTVEAEKTFTAFWQQRLRWAGKMRGVRGAGKWAGAFALLLPYFLLSVTLRFNLHDAAGQGLFRSAMLLASAWLMWLVPVIGLVRAAKKFVGQRHSTPLAVVNFLAFSIYALLVPIISVVVRPYWKGRRLE